MDIYWGIEVFSHEHVGKIHEFRPFPKLGHHNFSASVIVMNIQCYLPESFRTKTHLAEIKKVWCPIKVKRCTYKRFLPCSYRIQPHEGTVYYHFIRESNGLYQDMNMALLSFQNTNENVVNNTVHSF